MLSGCLRLAFIFDRPIEMYLNPLRAELVTDAGSRIAKITLSGEIGSRAGFEAYHVRDALQAVGSYDALFANFDSPGGSVFEAWIIYHYLMIGPVSQRPSLVLITGECSGAAILVAMGFKQIYMQSRACMRFEPIKLSNTAISRRATKTVARVVTKRTKSDVTEILQWMNERRTFFSKECLKHRLCDTVVKQ
jgi:ATP-dependent protease ClpP protease subunit